jgi:hypothetical protein
VWSGGAGPDSIYPLGYDGIGGYGSYNDFNSTNYPNVLLDGELCLCTDTQNIYMGDVNGTYIIIATNISGEIALDNLTPIVWELTSTGVFTLVTRGAGIPLEYNATPFFDIIYSATDAALINWNLTGPTYGENGTLQVTAVEYFTPNIPNPNPLLPNITPTTLTNTSSVIDKNLITPINLRFEARYDATHTKIQIYYIHDYAGSLWLSTSTIKWIAL